MNKNYLILFLAFVFTMLFSNAKAQKHEYSYYSSEFYLGHSLVNFLNPAYSKSVNNGTIDDIGINFEVGMKFTNRFLQYNLTFIHNEYKVKNGSAVLTQNDVRFGGFETGLSLFLMPRTSKYFSPYLGIGYLGGALKVEKPKSTSSNSSNQNNTSTADLPSARISAPLWKFGIMAAYKRISLNFEYRQSFAEPDRAFNQASFTIGYRFIRED